MFRLAFVFKDWTVVKYAAIGPIAVHFPQKVETNADLQAEYPSWDMPLIYEKTGIAQRYIAAPGECASDLAVALCASPAPSLAPPSAFYFAPPFAAAAASGPHLAKVLQ